MDYPASEITILNNDEFLLLLAASGLERWYGIELSEQRAALTDTRAFNMTLATLYQKGIIEWLGDKAEIAAAYKDMFRTLRDASRCILIKVASRPGYIKGSYCFRGMVTNVEGGATSGSEVELSLQRMDEWLGELKLSGYLPGTADMPEAGEEPIGVEDNISEFELRSLPDGELIRSLRIYDQGLFTMKEISEAGYSTKDICAPGDAENILSEWCGGES